MKLKPAWAIAVTVISTGAVIGGAFVADYYLRNNAEEFDGVCRDSYYVNGMDCRAKDANGNPISIDINTPETPRP